MANAKTLFTSFMRGTVQSLAAATLLGCALTLITAPTAHAQVFTVLHSFVPNRLGYDPYAGLVQDARGGLYGTTSNGNGPYGGAGSVYKLTHAQSGWTLTALVEFNHDGNGYGPNARLTFGPDGALYGTTLFGGYPGGCGGMGCGTVFRLNPASLSQTVIYRFTDSDGYRPFAEVTFDGAGNVFGTAEAGGAHGQGTVFKLVRNGNQWLHSDIYAFDGPSGYEPVAGVILDAAGNLYGTTVNGGQWDYGVVFELSPSSGGWSNRVLHSFSAGSDGQSPEASLNMDTAGNLYGTTESGGARAGGTVFELSPSGDNWNYRTICTLDHGNGPGRGPVGSVLIDAAGNLYGTTFSDGAYNQGSVFKLVPTGDGWDFFPIHDFTSLDDGANPIGNLLMDASGNILGTAWGGGQYGVGTVWEITP